MTSAARWPCRIQSVHVESIGDELCVYDTARQRVHSLNHTAAFVWQRCDGQKAPADLAAALSAEASIDDAEAVVQLTLQELADAQLLTAPIDEVAPVSRRDLLRRGVAAAAIPAIYSIVAPSPADAQSAPPPAAPTLTSVSPNQGLRGATVAVTLMGTNFVVGVGATTVAVSGAGVTVNNVVVGSGTSLTANFVLDLAAAAGPRTVTVTTAGGTSGGQTFTINLPAPGTTTFAFTASPETFTVPAGVVSITILATGASGSPGFGSNGGTGGLGGRTTATVSVTPGASLTVIVGGQGLGLVGGFNGGGGSTGLGGGGGGGSSVRNGATPLVVVGGGGGGGAESGGGPVFDGGNGAAGGGLVADPGGTPFQGGGGGGGGTQAAGGAAGPVSSGSFSGIDGTAGVADQGGVGGYHQPGIIGGGGGGGGFFGGGGGGGGNPSGAGGGGGGAGSSFAAPGATAVLHEQGVKASNGFVTISW